MPLANSFLKSTEEFSSEIAYPLDVYFCNHCSLVQLLDVIDPEVLFRNYIYVTGTSETMAAHNRVYAQEIVDLLHPSDKNLVIEIASNDGSLLKRFRQHNVRVLGVEPASNIAAIAERNGVATVNRFFDSSAADEIRDLHGSASVVIANNVLAHVDDTADFLTGCKKLISSDGIVVVEVPYLLHLLERLEYDTIYHEHLCYFSAASLVRLFQNAGFSVLKIEEKPVHGGSLRLYATQNMKPDEPGVLSLLERERAAGLMKRERYIGFANAVEKSRKALTETLMRYREQGKTLAGYGAPAKGNTLLNYCGIGPNLMPFTVDRSPHKIGTYTPGMHIPVLAPAKLLEDQPDYVLILAWNFAEEIRRQQSEYQQRGGRFLIPLPEPQLL